jgi:hypothetical protein
MADAESPPQAFLQAIVEDHRSDPPDDETSLEGFATDPRLSIIMFEGELDEEVLEEVGGFRAYTSSADAVGGVPAIVFAFEPHLANLSMDLSDPPVNEIKREIQEVIAQHIDDLRLGEPDAFEHFVAEYGLEMEVVDGRVYVYDPEGSEIRESLLAQESDGGFVDIEIE